MILEYSIECYGWSYDRCKGSFYSEDLANIYWLSYYSKLFDFVEIDSTFYKTLLSLWLKTGIKESKKILDLL
jgi:uncharacterized protein YecE (DUF72 family)